MKENIRETVRKLLRVARRAGGNEAEVARKHADDLMEKYGITVVDDNEDYREVVPGVAGNFWREQLLNGIARALDCRLLKVARGRRRYDAVLAGYASDVARVRGVYDRLNLDLVVQCRAAFKSYNSVASYDGDDEYNGPSWGFLGEILGVRRGDAARRDRFERAEDADAVYLAWQRAFLATASAEISKMVVNGPDKPRRGPVVYAPPDKSAEKREMDEEIERLRIDTEALSKRFDRYSAQEIQRQAVMAAKKAARDVGKRAVPTDRKLLAANSSFLPPPPPPPKPPEPSRWSELDL